MRVVLRTDEINTLRIPNYEYIISLVMCPTYCEYDDRRYGKMTWSVGSRRHRLPTAANSWLSSMTLCMISMTVIIADFKQKVLSAPLLRLLNTGDVIRQPADVEERVGVVKAWL